MQKTVEQQIDDCHQFIAWLTGMIENKPHVSDKVYQAWMKQRREEQRRLDELLMEQRKAVHV